MKADFLKRYLANHRPQKKWYRRFVKRAAVAIIYREQNGGEILMMLRADREGDPWSGHMSFPGGMKEHRDRHTLMTAQRETEEELGIAATAYAPCIGRLSDISAGGRHRKLKQLIVTPYVFIQQEPFHFRLNHEVKDSVWVPLSLFKNSSNRQYLTMQWRNTNLKLPYYMHRHYKIWGLSLIMIEELLKIAELQPN